VNLDMTVDINVTDKTFKGTLRQVLIINEATLTNEFINQPSSYVS
jgi:hypothetical protein